MSTKNEAPHGQAAPQGGNDQRPQATQPAAESQAKRHSPANELIAYTTEMNQPPARQEGEAQQQQQQPKKFTWVTASQIKARPPMKWRVKNLLPAVGSAMLYGNSNTGKSLTMIDLAAKIALGEHWHGLKVKPTTVVYFYLEASEGLQQRILAWEQVNRMLYPEGGDYVRYVDNQQLTLPNDEKALLEITPENSVLIIDTLAKASTGLDTNSNADMTTWLGALDRIIIARKCFAIFVHHSTKMGNTWSGAGCLFNSPNCVFELSNRNGTITLKDPKQRDTDKGKNFSFTLEVATLGEDEDGDAITSAAPMPCDNSKYEQNEGRRLTSREELCLHCIETLAKDAPDGTVHERDLRRLFYERLPLESSLKDPQQAREKAFRDVRIGLQNKEKIGKNGEIHWIIP